MTSDPLLPRDGAFVEAQRQLVEKLSRAKEDWLEGLMSKILPPEMVFNATSENPLVRAEVHKFMVENNIMLVEQPDCTEVVRDQTVLGVLKITMKDGKLNIETKEMI